MAVNPHSNQTSKGRPSEEPITTVVVHKKGKKTFISTFDGTSIDDIIDSSKRKPLIDNSHEIVDIGVGKSFIEKYSKLYKTAKLI
jgi:hypothetical protein